MFDECTHPHILKEELVKSASAFCRKITSFALLEDIKELQGMCFSPNELYSLNEHELVGVCQLIVSKSMDYNYDLKGYGIESQAISAFQDLIERFKLALNDKGSSEKMEEQTMKGFSSL